ncbi:MAG TPA: SCO family protein, partial [Blastocatellia bacterium]|nr:SCO family protein [Blastocatellia bacterium]
MSGTARFLAVAVIGLLFVCALKLEAGVKSSGQSVTGHDLRPKGDLSLSIPDVEVFNQDGKKVRFYSDLIRGKVAVISFGFTSCTYICPMQGETLSRLQAVLGNRLSKEVNIISVSLDPETDTPARLKSWGAQFGARPGWTFVTGKRSEIDKVAKAFTGGEALKGEHSPVVFVGSDRQGVWVRAYGLAEPER